MAPTDSVPEFEARRSFYKIDDRVRSVLAGTWPIIAPTIGAAIDDVVEGIQGLPYIGKVAAQHRDSIIKLELAHFQALLGGSLDHHYAESCRRTVEHEAAIGLDARIRSSAGNSVLRRALDALARAHRFSAAKLAERGKVVSQVISFDVANAMTLHRQAAEQAALARRSKIDRGQPYHELDRSPVGARQRLGNQGRDLLHPRPRGVKSPSSFHVICRALR
jgi:hypothetical protein